MSDGEPRDEDQRQGHTVYLAELQCFLCGSQAGTIEVDRKPMPAYGIWHPLGGEPLTRVADWRQLRCHRCGGALYAESIEAVTKHNDEEELRREAPRRGRPPKWLVEERRKARESADPLF